MEQMKKQLKIFDADKITRILGVKDEKFPYIGCLKGHIHALGKAKEKQWDNVLILEDDAVWNNIEMSYPIFETLVKQPYDVIMLGGTYPKFDTATFKVSEAKSASAYLVHKNYYDTLINKANEILTQFSKDILPKLDLNTITKESIAEIHYKVAYDLAVFGPLQKEDAWYIVYPALMIQSGSYSDIEQKDVNYESLYTTKGGRRHTAEEGRYRKRSSKKIMSGGEGTPVYPPDSINDYITHVVYINLDKRTDRNEQTQIQLKIFPAEKVSRMSGVEDMKFPYIGCLKSHLNALKLAKQKQWNNTLILEDDAIWQNVEGSFPIFERLVKDHYDVIMLGGTLPEFDHTTYKVIKSRTSSAYLVKKEYYDTIMKKIQDVLNYFTYIVPQGKELSKIESDQLHSEVAYDKAVFYPLQEVNSWYIVYPPLMTQVKGYSNIETMPVNYKNLYTPT
jgi:GR25 family glycosyltransferase involved in LPS biosynthesis